MRKSLFVLALLAFVGLLLAKSYTLSITGPTKVGDAQLAKGIYTVTVDGDKAIFTDDHYKTVTVTVKVENGTGKKFQETTTETKTVDGTPIITKIYLGGSTSTLDFTN